MQGSKKQRKAKDKGEKWKEIGSCWAALGGAHG